MLVQLSEKENDFILDCNISYRRATTLRPDRRVVAGYKKNAPLCDCNRDRDALARRSDARHFVSPIAFPLRPLRQCDAHTTASRRPGHALSVTIGDHQRSECDLTAMLLRLRRLHYAAWVLPLRLLRTHGVHTMMILRRPSAFCHINGSIPWQSIVFWTHCVNANARFYILKTNYDFIQIWIISIQIRCNVNHKVMNGQYWKLHMIVLFR